jgi:sugar lactone lactonase YvrE
MIPQILYSGHCELAEGPMWHAELNSLFWVDILQKKFYQQDFSNDKLTAYKLPTMPGAIVPTQNPELVCLSLENGIANFNLKTQSLDYVQKFHQNRPDLRANDGKVDPEGNFWIGTMSKTCEEAVGSLYVYNEQIGLQTKLANTTISNGITWSPDQQTMYYIDSWTHSIRKYIFKGVDTSMISADIVVQNEDLKYFDGMTIDTEGMLWVAHCGAGCIRRWNPETGQELLKIDFPCPKVTSLTFGGPNMSTLFVTTAYEHLSDAERYIYPQSGQIFAIETSYKGLPTNTIGSKTQQYDKL